MPTTKQSKKLGAYRAKRDFEATSEPTGGPDALLEEDGHRFVVQEHHATRLHWDLRLEHGHERARRMARRDRRARVAGGYG